MYFRSPTGRIILGVVLALSLALGGVAAIAATAASNPSLAGGATHAAPASTVHTIGMSHGQNSGDSKLARVLCLMACMGLTAAPSLPVPGIVLAHLFYVMQPHVAGRDAGDQVLNRPTSPPPRAFAKI